MERAVVFPETDKITSASCRVTKDELKREVIDALDSTTNVTMLAPSMKTLLRGYAGNALLQSSPLQLPGRRGPAPAGRGKKATAGAKIEHI